jgi:CBS domain-containing protein
MFPGYPLDGGRVLRAYLWRSGKDLDEATMLTGRSGQAIAVVLVIFGLYVAVVRRDFFTGFWAMLVGVFLFDAAAGIIREVRSHQHRYVEDAMMLAITVDPASTIHEFVEQILPMHRQNLFAIARERRLHGLLLLSDLKRIGSEKWHKVTIASVMRPVSDEFFVETGTTFSDAREICRQNGLGSVAVLDAEGRLVGVFHGTAAR